MGKSQYGRAIFLLMWASSSVFCQVSDKMYTNIYTKEELGYFRLAKGVRNYSTAALRKVFKEEWNYLYPATPWRNDGTSGAQMLAEEQPPFRFSRLYDPKFANDYQVIKDHLRHGNVEEWDVTTLVFAFLYSHALSGIRNNSRHWRRIKNAIHQIKEVRNTLSHDCEASIPPSAFARLFGILEQAMEDLLARSDPLVKKLKTLRTETEFVTVDLVKYKKLLQEDHKCLLVLDKHLERLERKMNISVNESEAEHTHDRSIAESSVNSKIISHFCRRVDRIERDLSTVPIDLTPGRFKPSIFHSARYIRLMNESASMSNNFRWDELGDFLQGFTDGVDMQIFAGIQSAVALSHRSRKDECFEVLNSLIPKALFAKQYGVVLFARIKIYKAYNLHDRGDDDAAMREADEAEMMLSLGECHEDLAEIHCAKANIILSSRKNSADARERILHHLDQCIYFCEKAPVNKSITAAQAKLRKALFHLGYYQYGILEEVPNSSDVKVAETILNRVAEQSDLTERSKVYLMYGQSLLCYRKGDTGMAIKLENKLRRKCEEHDIRFEIEQLDMLRTLVRGS